MDKTGSIEQSIGKFPPNYTQELSGGGGVSWTAGLVPVRNVHINQKVLSNSNLMQDGTTQPVGTDSMGEDVRPLASLSYSGVLFDVHCRSILSL